MDKLPYGLVAIGLLMLATSLLRRGIASTMFDDSRDQVELRSFARQNRRLMAWATAFILVGAIWTYAAQVYGFSLPWAS